MTEPKRPLVWCVVDDDGLMALLESALASTVPSLAVERVTMDEFVRMRRLVAAGEIALGLQHSINNPLTALLAECQLLEMEPLAPDQLESMHRIVALCRRTIEVVRRLDTIAAEPLIQRHDPSTTSTRP